MSDTWREWEGQIVDGAFQLRRHLGGSDHSVVFLTERGEGKTQKAAIKFVQAEGASAERQLSRWKQVAQLSHPNLIKLFETGRCQLAGMDLLYVVVEYAEENLAQFLPQRPLSPAETRDMLEPFLDALRYLHGQGLVHGRIQPSNILAIDDQLKLSSDTICRIGESRVASTKPNAYAPPEAASEKISPAQDLWSLGMTLVETLTQHPLAAPQGQENAQVPDSLPEPFLDIVRHCLVREPQRRWTAAEVAVRLNPSAKPPAPPVSTQPVAVPSAASTLPAPTVAAPAKPPAATIPVPAKPPAPAKPVVSLDPLSVPLSTVAPLHSTRRQALQNQAIPGQSKSARPYYILFGVLLALIFGAILAIPRLGNHGPQAEPASSTGSTPSAPAQNQQPLTPTKVAPAVPSKPEPKSQKKSAAPATNQPAQRSSLQPAEQDSMQTAGDRQSLSKDQSSASASPAPAALRSAVPRSDATAAPFVSNRDASIAAGAVTPGEVLSQVVPEVSQKSRNTIHGKVRVIVKVHVDSSGNVSSAELATAGPSRFFADAALQAAHRWDFAPAKVDGHNVPSEWLLHFDFTPTETNVTPLPTKP